MNRAFKTQFHNGGEKIIVTMSVVVNNGKLFKSLDAKGKKALVSLLLDFRNSVGFFANEIGTDHYHLSTTKVSRSSKTGKFVSKKYAVKHKATTQTEKVARKK